MTKVHILNTGRCLGRRVSADGSGGGHRRRRRARAKCGIRLKCCWGRRAFNGLSFYEDGDRSTGAQSERLMAQDCTYGLQLVGKS